MSPNNCPGKDFRPKASVGPRWHVPKQGPTPPSRLRDMLDSFMRRPMSADTKNGTSTARQRSQNRIMKSKLQSCSGPWRRAAIAAIVATAGALTHLGAGEDAEPGLKQAGTAVTTERLREG